MQCGNLLSHLNDILHLKNTCIDGLLSRILLLNIYSDFFVTSTPCFYTDVHVQLSLVPHYHTKSILMFHKLFASILLPNMLVNMKILRGTIHSQMWIYTLQNFHNVLSLGKLPAMNDTALLPDATKNKCSLPVPEIFKNQFHFPYFHTVSAMW